LVGRAPKAPKVVSLTGKAEEDDGGKKRGPGRPPGSGSGSKKKASDDGDESLAQLITAGVQMAAALAVGKRGPHWAPLGEQAENIGTLAAKVVSKWFPTPTKFSDEALLAVAIGQAIGPALMIELMMMMNKREEATANGPAEASSTRSSGPAPAGDRSRGAADRREQPDDGASSLRSNLVLLPQ
jgi:hypothetical protein